MNFLKSNLDSGYFLSVGYGSESSIFSGSDPDPFFLEGRIRVDSIRICNRCHCRYRYRKSFLVPNKTTSVVFLDYYRWPVFSSSKFRLKLWKRKWNQSIDVYSLQIRISDPVRPWSNPFLPFLQNFFSVINHCLAKLKKKFCKANIFKMKITMRGYNYRAEQF